LSKLAVDSTAGPQRPPGELARSIAECLSEIDDRLRGWRRSSGVVRAAKDRCVVAAVSGEEVGWVAAVDDGRLLAAILIHATLTTEQLVVSDDPAVIARTIALADGAPRAVYDAERQSALAAVTSHLREEWTSRMCGVQVITGRSARAIETHIERWVAVAPRHERPIAVDTAARLRRAMQCANPLGVERALLAHCRSGIRPGANQDARPPAGAGHPKDAMSWLLRAMEIVGDARGARSHSSNDGCIPRPVAVLLVGPARV
jgi:hypothetical protein